VQYINGRFAGCGLQVGGIAKSPFWTGFGNPQAGQIWLSGLLRAGVEALAGKVTQHPAEASTPKQKLQPLPHLEPVQGATSG